MVTRTVLVWNALLAGLCRGAEVTAFVALGLLPLAEQVAWANAGLPQNQQINTLPEFPPSPEFIASVVADTQAVIEREREAEAAKRASEARALLKTRPAQAGAIGSDPGQGYVRLPGHMLDALASATPAVPEAIAPLTPEASAKQQELSLTLVLRRDDQAGFDRYLKEVYDPQSEHYRQFLTQAQLAERFGPSRKSYQAVLNYLRENGLALAEGSNNRMTLVVRGTRAQVERAFDLTIGDYRIGEARFYANNSDPALPTAVASRVAAISGLANLARPESLSASGICDLFNNVGTNTSLVLLFAVLLGLLAVTLAFPWAAPATIAAAEGLGGGIGAVGVGVGIAESNFLWNAICAATKNTEVNLGAYGASGGGSGPALTAGPGTPAKGTSVHAQAEITNPQVVGIVAFDTFEPSDISDYIAFMNSIGFNNVGQISNLSKVDVNGGVATPGSGESEVLLDIVAVMGIAPDARVVVYDAPFDGRATSYTAVFNAMIDDGVTVISNSWASCENEVTRADVEAIDSVLQSAAASGISVFNASGDSGSTCLNGSPDTITVPANSPSATAVGGTSLHLGPGLTYGSETWWDGTNDTPPSGQGGFGVSRFFPRPTYQDGLNGSTMRSIPDVAIAADPAHGGIFICQASNGGCPSGLLFGGTSLSAPQWAALTAVLNERQGRNLGALNPQIYPLANTDAFHSAESMGSDFAHVGLGSPNVNVLNRMLAGEPLGPPDPDMSEVAPIGQLGNLFAVGDGETLSLAVAADGETQGGMLVTLRDANGYTIGGKTVTLTAEGADVTITPSSAVTSVDNGAAVFMVTTQTPGTATFTATTDGVELTAKPELSFTVPPATSAVLNAFPTSVAADGSSTTTITVTLQDSLGRPTPGKLIRLSQGDGSSVISGPNPAVTDAGGQIQFTATNDINETVTYTAVDVTDGLLPIPGSGVVTFDGATASNCTANPPVAGEGFAVTSFATGFPAGDFFFSNVNFSGCPGATHPFFDASGAVLIPDFRTGDLYKLGADGGAVSSSDVITNLGQSIGTLVRGKDGSLFATRSATGGGFNTGDVIQIDPATGAILRTLAAGLTCPAGLAVDPLSGDLFFGNICYGAGSDDPSLLRLSNPAGDNPSVSVYAMLPFSSTTQIVFAPNGTIYAASGCNPGQNGVASIVRVGGTDRPQPAAVTDTGVVSDNCSLAIGRSDASGEARTLIVHADRDNDNGGSLAEVDITADPPTVTTVLATGDIAAGIVGPDGCLYAGVHHVVLKIANSDGACTSTPTSPSPALALSPTTVSPNPAQGSAQTFTATLKNVESPAGVPVFFAVTGANPQVKMVRADADGKATFSYVAVHTGADIIVASAKMDEADDAVLTAAPARVTWDPGTQTTFLSLGPAGGTLHQPATVSATLTNVSASPAERVANQFVDFALDGSTCRAVTDENGTARCELTPSQTGLRTLTASFAGDSQLTAADASNSFLGAAPVESEPPPDESEPPPDEDGGDGGGAWGWLTLLLLAALGALRRRKPWSTAGRKRR